MPQCLGWERQLQQPRDSSVCNRRDRPKGPSSFRARCPQQQKQEQCAGCPLRVRDKSGSICYILALVSIILCFHLSVLNQPCALSKGERIYKTQWAKSQMSLLFRESCDVTGKHVGSEYHSPLLLLGSCLLFSWTETWENYQAEKGRDVTEVVSTPHCASAHREAPVGSGIQHAFACLLLPTSSKLE